MATLRLLLVSLLHVHFVREIAATFGPDCVAGKDVLSSCDFDSGTCGYSIVPSDSGGLKWKTARSLTNGVTTRIDHDWHPAGKQAGSFVYLDVGDVRVPAGSKARLWVNHEIGDVNAICVTFRYASAVGGKGGSGGGGKVPELGLYNQMAVSKKGTVDRVLGKVTKNTRGKWKEETFNACVWRKSKLYFEAEKVSNHSWIAIDHVTISKSTIDCYCTHERNGLPSCSFDNNFCSDYFNETADENLVWKRATSVHDNQITLIAGDYQPPGKHKQGNFVYLDVTNSSAKIGSKSALKGHIVGNNISNVCIDLRYVTSGSTPQVISVYYRGEGYNQPRRLIGWITDATQGQWKLATFTSGVRLRSDILFEAEKLSHKSYVALDYIDVRKWKMYKPTTTTSSSVTTTTTATTTTKTPPTSKSKSLPLHPRKPNPVVVKPRSATYIEIPTEKPRYFSGHLHFQQPTTHKPKRIPPAPKPFKPFITHRPPIPLWTKHPTKKLFPPKLFPQGNPTTLQDKPTTKSLHVPTPSTPSSLAHTTLTTHPRFKPLSEITTKLPVENPTPSTPSSLAHTTLTAPPRFKPLSEITTKLPVEKPTPSTPSSLAHTTLATPPRFKPLSEITTKSPVGKPKPITKISGSKTLIDAGTTFPYALTNTETSPKRSVFTKVPTPLSFALLSSTSPKSGNSFLKPTQNKQEGYKEETTTSGISAVTLEANGTRKCTDRKIGNDKDGDEGKNVEKKECSCSEDPLRLLLLAACGLLSCLVVCLLFLLCCRKRKKKREKRGFVKTARRVLVVSPSRNKVSSGQEVFTHDNNVNNESAWGRHVRAEHIISMKKNTWNTENTRGDLEWKPWNAAVVDFQPF